MNIRLSIPSLRRSESNSSDKSGSKSSTFTVFRIDVCIRGIYSHSVERRYSEFEDLHKKLRSIIQAPHFPPRKVLKWNSNVLEQRRVDLDIYLKNLMGICSWNLPQDLINFLQIKDPDDDIDEVAVFKPDNYSTSDQPPISFKDISAPYLTDEVEDDPIFGTVLDSIYPQ